MDNGALSEATKSDTVRAAWQRRLRQNHDAHNGHDQKPKDGKNHQESSNDLRMTGAMISTQVLGGVFARGVELDEMARELDQYMVRTTRGLHQTVCSGITRLGLLLDQETLSMKPRRAGTAVFAYKGERQP